MKQTNLNKSLERLELQGKAIWYDMIMLYGLLMCILFKWLVVAVAIIIICQLFEYLEMKKVRRFYRK